MNNCCSNIQSTSHAHYSISLSVPSHGMYGIETLHFPLGIPMVAGPVFLYLFLHSNKTCDELQDYPFSHTSGTHYDKIDELYVYIASIPQYSVTIAFLHATLLAPLPLWQFSHTQEKSYKASLSN